MPSAHILLGNVLREKGELTVAIQQFEEALRLAPESEEAVFQLGLCYLDKNWSEARPRVLPAGAREEPPAARVPGGGAAARAPAGLRAAARSTGPAPPRSATPRRAPPAAILQRAQELYRKAMRAEPRNPTIRVSFALLSASMGRWNEAIAACREVLAADPEDVVAAAACSTLAEALRAEGNAREAAAEFLREFLEKHPSKTAPGRRLLRAGDEPGGVGGGPGSRRSTTRAAPSRRRRRS